MSAPREFFPMNENSGDWLTCMLLKLWPFVTAAVEKQVAEIVPGILEQSKPKWMESISLDKFKLGPEAPKITEISVDKNDDDDIPEVRLVIGLDWQSKTDIELTVKPLPENMKLVPGFLENALQYMATAHAGVENLSIQATAIITLSPLCGVIPVMRALQVSLREAPKLDFRITVFQGQSGILNLLKPWLLKLIVGIVGGMLVAPEHICVKLDPTAPDFFKPEGVLSVKVLEARDLPSMDWFSKSDAFVEGWVRSKKKKKTKVVKGKSPKWDETLNFLVHTRQYQKLTLQLLDEDSGTSHDSIGYAYLPLAQLVPGEPADMWIPVCKDDAEGSKPLGKTQLHVQTTYLTSNSPGLDVIFKNLNLQAGQLLPKVADSPADAILVANSACVKVTLMAVSLPDPKLAPLMAKIIVAGQEEVTGLVKPSVENSNELVFNQTRDWELYGNEVDDAAAIVVQLMQSAKGPPVAAVTIPLSDVKAMNKEPGALGGVLDLKAADFNLKMEVWYFGVYHPLAAK